MSKRLTTDAALDEFKRRVQEAWSHLLALGKTKDEAEAALRRAWNVAIRGAWEQKS